MKGFIQVYTGNGKGKTTAAYGLALRAAGAGMKVLILQFIKNKDCSELKALERFSDLITIQRYGTGCFIRGKPRKEDLDCSTEGLEFLKQAISSGKYQVVILDEVNVALSMKLLPLEELLHIIQGRPENMEIVLTGRYAHPRIIEMADLVTEMLEIKHYYHMGVNARIGIEK